jgi:hypothetical protein
MSKEVNGRGDTNCDEAMAKSAEKTRIRDL